MANMPRNRSRTGSRWSWLIAATYVCGLSALGASRSALEAQLIPVRTVPVAEADQFGFFPAANFGMGGVSIALTDSLLDPFRNPAKASRIGRALYFGSPTLFSVSNHAGSGQALPVGAILRSGTTFLGGALALQEISPARPINSFFPGAIDVLGSSTFGPPVPDAEPNKSASNRYAYATAGHRLQRTGVTIAVSGMWSDLRAMEGVELLFNGSHNVRQSGERLDLRLGLLKEWNGQRSFEAMVLHSRHDMSYDVGYAQLYWDPATRQNRVQTFNKQSEDGNRTLGLHLGYVMPLPDSGWQVGGVVTANRIAHDRAPYYRIMGVPRDAGYSSAYNVGAGVSRSLGPSRIAIDAIFEPIWRRGTGRADSAILAGAGQLAPGSVTGESYFKFANFVLRGGVSRDVRLAIDESRMRLQFGMQMRGVNYTLEQHDFIQGTFRSGKRSWKEWTHAWGASFVFPRFEFGYQLRLASGMGRIGVPPDNGGGFLASPLSPFPGQPTASSVTMYPVRVSTHQLTVSVPLR